MCFGVAVKTTCSSVGAWNDVADRSKAQRQFRHKLLPNSSSHSFIDELMFRALYRILLKACVSLSGHFDKAINATLK